jgi:hypothetical protein
LNQRREPVPRRNAIAYGASMWLPCPPIPTSAIARGEWRLRISFKRAAISPIAVSQSICSKVPSGWRRIGWRTRSPCST